MDKETIIIVIKVGVQNKSDEEFSWLLQNIKKQVGEQVGNVSYFYVPIYDTENIEIECINPKLVTIDSYKEAEEKLSNLKIKIDEALIKNES